MSPKRAQRRPPRSRKAQAKAKAAAHAVLPWREIQRRAEDGGQILEILKALSIAPEVLEDPETKAKIEDIVGQAHATLRLSVRRQLRRRATRKGSGSPNVLAMQARNLLGYDRTRDAEQAPLPIEIAGAADRLLETVKLYQRAKVDPKGKGA